MRKKQNKLNAPNLKTSRLGAFCFQYLVSQVDGVIKPSCKCLMQVLLPASFYLQKEAELLRLRMFNVLLVLEGQCGGLPGNSVAQVRLIFRNTCDLF